MALRGHCLVVAMLFLATHAPAAAPDATSDRVSTFLESTPSRQAVTRAEQAASIASRLSELQLDDALGGSPASYEEADLQFRVAQHAFFYTSGDRYLDAMAQALEAIQATGGLDERHRRAWYRALLQVRRFEDAKVFRTRHDVGDVPRLPERIIDLARPVASATAWTLEGEDTLRRVLLAVENLKILVVAHPGCGFSRRAADEIGKDPSLSRLFESRAQWLAPQDANLDASAFRNWNEAHPDLSMLIAHDADELPQLTTWATPTFYFLREGRVIDKVEGWPKGGRRDALLAAARSLQDPP
jgi:hypothetical protein